MKRILLISFCLITWNYLAAQQVLSLEECIQLALTQNADMKVKKEEIKIAEYKKNQAKTAYLPKFDATVAYIRLSDKIYLLSEDKFLPIGTLMADGTFGFTADQVNNQWTEVGGQPVPLDANGNPFNPVTDPDKILWKEYTTIPREELAVDARNTFVGAVSMVQPVYMGGRIVEANRMAQIGIDIAKEQLTQQESEVLYNTENSYWTVVSVSEKVKAAKSYQVLLEELTRDVTELYNEGMATRADILKVKVRLNEVNMTLTTAENGLSLAKMQLAQSIGLPVTDTIFLQDEIREEREMDGIMGIVLPEQPDMEEIYDNRPEIRSLQKLIELSEAQKKLASADYLPEIGLLANYMVSNPNFFNGFEKEFSGSWNVGVVMRIPLWHWGEQKQKVRSAKSERIINEIKLDDAKEKIELQYRQAAYKINESVKKLQETATNMEEAEENLRYALLSFEEGMVAIAEVLEAEAAWYKAYSEQTDAQIEFRMNILNLRKAAGELTVRN